MHDAGRSGSTGLPSGPRVAVPGRAWRPRRTHSCGAVGLIRRWWPRAHVTGIRCPECGSRGQCWRGQHAGVAIAARRGPLKLVAGSIEGVGRSALPGSVNVSTIRGVRGERGVHTELAMLVLRV